MSVDKAWHDFVAKLEHLRHRIDPKFHNDLDELGLHATKIKLAAEAGAAPVAAQAAEAAAKVVVEDMTKEVK